MIPFVPIAPEPAMIPARALLVSAGTPAFTRDLPAFVEGGEANLMDLLSALEEGAPTGATGADYRDVTDHLDQALVALARALPDPFLRAVLARPTLASRPDVLLAVSFVPGGEAAGLLRTALRRREVSLRWRAVEALARRRDPDVARDLDPLLADRNGLVSWQAWQWALRQAGPANLPTLLRLLGRARLPPGHRTFLMDALECTSLRHGMPLPEGFPARIRAVRLPAGVAVPDHAEQALFPAGVPLGQGPDGPWSFPEDTFVVLRVPGAAGGGDTVWVRDPTDRRSWPPEGPA